MVQNVSRPINVKRNCSKKMKNKKHVFPPLAGEAENHSFYQNIVPISSIVLGYRVSYYITSHDNVGVGAQ